MLSGLHALLAVGRGHGVFLTSNGGLVGSLGSLLGSVPENLLDVSRGTGLLGSRLSKSLALSSGNLGG